MNDADIMLLHATASFLLQGLVLSFFVEYIEVSWIWANILINRALMSKNFLKYKGYMITDQFITTNRVTTRLNMERQWSHRC
jgi:hypothetical protein